MMRKKPMQNNNYGHHNKRRHHQQGRHGGHGGGGPKRNYGAAREKYLQQARDALSSGDRVMAEYYYQHAEHCFRMMAEENGGRPPRQFNGPQNQPGEQQQEQTDGQGQDRQETYPEENATGQLPAFITTQAIPPATPEE